MAESYQDLMKLIWEATNPDNPGVVKLLIGGERMAVAIASLRAAQEMFKVDMSDPSEEVHGRIWAEEAEESLAKLAKNTARLVSDYARYLERVQDCSCAVCMAAQAENN